MTLTPHIFSFLKGLQKHNNRAWFAAHKNEYQACLAEVKQFFKEVEDALLETDMLERHKIFRIYRDVRFSKDKTPFKTRFAGYFIRASAERRGGYYLNIEPGNSLVGGGFYGPNPEDLKRIRQEFEQDDSEMRAILAHPNFKRVFGGLQGEEVKSAPRGFDKEHPAIDLIRKKQFYVVRKFTDAEVLNPDFSARVMESYLLLRPFFDYMSSVLSTNLNGESII